LKFLLQKQECGDNFNNESIFNFMKTKEFLLIFVSCFYLNAHAQIRIIKEPVNPISVFYKIANNQDPTTIKLNANINNFKGYAGDWDNLSLLERPSKFVAIDPYKQLKTFNYRMIEDQKLSPLEETLINAMSIGLGGLSAWYTGHEGRK
jgi:hypothetical protein